MCTMAFTKSSDPLPVSDVHLSEGISFQLRYLGSTRIFRYNAYRFRLVDIPFGLLFVLTYAIMFVLHALTLVHCRSLTEFTDLMYVFGIQINELVKMYDIISHDTRIRTMIDGLHERHMYPLAWRHGDQLRAAQRHVRMSSLLLYVCAGSSAAMVFISPLFKTERALPFASWFPMRTDTDRNYWLAYAQEFAYVFYLSPMNITLDTFLTGLMHFVAVKLEILREELLRLGEPRETKGRKRRDLTCTERLKELRDVIVYHQEIVFMIKEIEEIFNRGIFAQCLTCGSTLCIVGYRILIAEPFTSDFFAMVLILTAFLGEIFYYCHYGNEIQVKANELANALYASRWYEFECRCGPRVTGRHGPHQRALMSSVSMVMERIKRPAYVTAGKLVKLTYETFISICRGGFQAFAVLRDMQDK